MFIPCSVYSEKCALLLLKQVGSSKGKRSILRCLEGEISKHFNLQIVRIGDGRLNL